MAFPFENLRNPKAVARFFLTCAIGLSLDLWTKHAAVVRLKDSRDAIEFIPNWLHWEYTENHGAVFGIGQGQATLFVTVSIFAIALLTYMFATSGRKPLTQIVLGMLLAGVLGNMYDRVQYGYVRDMIHALPGWLNPLRGMFPSWQYVFPWIFNVADIMLCVGVGLTLVLGLFQQDRETPAHGTSQPSDTSANAGSS